MRNLPRKLTMFAVAVAAVAAVAIGPASTSRAGADPRPAMRSALGNLEAALGSLHKAAGGRHRARAIKLTVQAIEELKSGIRVDGVADLEVRDVRTSRGETIAVAVFAGNRS